MPDPTNFQVPAKAGPTKAVVTGIILEIAQHVNPMLVSWLAAKYPIVGDALSAEIIDLIEAGLGGFLIWLTPQHFVQSIKDAIIFMREAWAQWRDAFKQPEQ